MRDIPDATGCGCAATSAINRARLLKHAIGVNHRVASVKIRDGTFFSPNDSRHLAAAIKLVFKKMCFGRLGGRHCYAILPRMVKAWNVRASFLIVSEPTRRVHSVIRRYPFRDDWSRAEHNVMLMDNPDIFVVNERYRNLLE